MMSLEERAAVGFTVFDCINRLHSVRCDVIGISSISRFEATRLEERCW